MTIKHKMRKYSPDARENPFFKLPQRLVDLAILKKIGISSRKVVYGILYVKLQKNKY